MRFLTRDKAFYTALVTLAIPVVLQNLVAFAVNFTDNLMVSSLGDGAVSGVYVGNQLHMLIQIFANGVGGVVLVLAAQYWGRADARSIRRITAIGVQCSVALGLWPWRSSASAARQRSWACWPRERRSWPAARPIWALSACPIRFSV